VFFFWLLHFAAAIGRLKQLAGGSERGGGGRGCKEIGKARGRARERGRKTQRKTERENETKEKEYETERELKKEREMHLFKHIRTGSVIEGIHCVMKKMFRRLPCQEFFDAGMHHSAPFCVFGAHGTCF